MDRFLKLKHWQLFALWVGVPLIFGIFLFNSLAKNITIIGQDPTPYLQSIANMSIYFAIAVLIIAFIHFGWYWSVGIKLQDKIPPDLKMKTGMFKFFLIFPYAYVIVFSSAILWLLSVFSGLQNGDMVTPWFAFIPMFLFPIHFFTIFCTFYCMYFTARTIKTAELQRVARMDDYIGEFFLIWFFPIGVWILQPRLNKLIAEDENSICKPGSDYRIKY